MAWSYSGNPSNSDLDMARFIIGDTEADDPQMTDEEINACLALGGTVKLGALICVKMLKNKYAKQCDYKLGPEQVTASQRYEHYKELYQSMSDDLIATKTVPQAPDTSTGTFDVGMMDNGGGQYGFND